MGTFQSAFPSFEEKFIREQVAHEAPLPLRYILAKYFLTMSSMLELVAPSTSGPLTISGISNGMNIKTNYCYLRSSTQSLDGGKKGDFVTKSSSLGSANKSM